MDKLRVLQRHQWGLSWWWWWEIGALLISIIGVSLIITILVRYKDTSLSSWPFSIRPNSLISALTTLARSALLLPITSCISQLKWLHFRQPRPLHQLQVLDDASRGPWGALVLLYRMRVRPWLVSMLAIVMVAALAIETTTQQVLEYPSRDSELVLNETSRARLWTATTYELGFLRAAWSQKGDHCWKQMALIDASVPSAILGVESRPHVQCPTGAKQCVFPTLTTLAMCSEVKNYTNHMTANCTATENFGTLCSFHWTFKEAWSTSNLTGALEMTFNYQVPESNGGVTYLTTGDQHMQAGTLYPLSNGKGVGFAAVRKQATTDRIPGQSHPKVELFLVHLQWCEQTFTLTTTTPDGQVSGILGEEIVLQGPINNTTDSDYAREYVSMSTGQRYYISPDTDWILGNILSKHLCQSITRSRGSYQSPTDSSYVQHDFLSWRETYLGHYLSVTDLDKVASNVASAVSTFIRSPAEMVGGNLNATTINGKALITETYIRVRWQWLILPILETVLTACLLAITIMVDRRSGYPLLKNSSLGLLFYGLQETKLPLDIEQGITMNGDGVKGEQLEGIAKKVVAQFKVDADGKLGFIRTPELEHSFQVMLVQIPE
ncbi:Protein of unknown function (DUF3176) domain containing protein [Rhypophila decipiens]